MPRCPICSSTFLRPLPLSAVGRLRARFTAKRPWGCWHCGWRDWVEPNGPDDGASPEGGAGEKGDGHEDSDAPAGSRRRPVA